MNDPADETHDLSNPYRTRSGAARFTPGAVGGPRRTRRGTKVRIGFRRSPVATLFPPVASRTRHGFSLLEILLALAILGGAMAVLAQIAGTGTDASREARDLAVARIIAQTKLSELLLDRSITPQSVPPTPVESFDGDSMSEFTYSIEVQPAPLDGLLAVRVTVEAVNPNGGAPLATYTLDRWMIDPMLGLEQLEAEEQAAREAETEVP